MEPLIKDTPNEGHLCLKDTLRGTNLAIVAINTLIEDNLTIKEKMIRPNVSII